MWNLRVVRNRRKQYDIFSPNGSLLNNVVIVDQRDTNL